MTIQSHKDDINMRATRKMRLMGLPELLAAFYKPTHFQSCGMLRYLPPALDRTDYGQFSAASVSLLIINYISEKARARL